MAHVTRLLRRENWLAIGILLLAFVVRIWSLEMKPPHFDEGINGHFVMQMWKEGFYKYDPTNFHGPLYFYFLQLSELLLGRGIFAFRFITVLFSLGAILVVIAHRRFFGSVVYLAALVLAISPACVFYARYAIHEWLFILLQIVFTYGYYLYKEEKSRASVGYMVAGVFGTFAVKETFFIFFGTWMIAVFCVDVFEKILKSDRVRNGGARVEKLSAKERKARQKKKRDSEVTSASAADSSFLRVRDESDATRADQFAIVAIGLIAVLALFSGFFVHTRGIGDMFRAFMFWTKTGTAASGHDKPFGYWVTILWRYEWPTLLALIFSPLAFFYSTTRARIMILTSFGTWLAYSIIPYKTPWLILNVIWPLAFTLGFAFAAIRKGAQKFFVPPVRWALYALTVVCLGNAALGMFNLVFVNFVNPKEPYVYVQSTMQFKAAMDRIAARVKARPEDLNMRLLVLNRDTWPMPWTLSAFPNLVWGNAETADLNDAAVVLIDASARAMLESRLTGKYWVTPFHIRDAYDEGWAYFQFDKFQGIVPAESPIFEKAVGGVSK